MQTAKNKVNRTGLAVVFGVAATTIDAWVRAGCPYDEKGASGREWRFDTADVARWRERRAAEDASDGGAADEAALKRRKLAAEARLSELELATRSGKVASIEVMESVLSRTFAELQGRLRGPLVTRLATQLIGETDERKFKRVLLAEIDAALEILSKVDPAAFDANADTSAMGFTAIDSDHSPS